jgi:hypothetical protein
MRRNRLKDTLDITPRCIRTTLDSRQTDQNWRDSPADKNVNDHDAGGQKNARRLRSESDSPEMI